MDSIRISILQDPTTAALAEYATIPIAFEVKSVFDVLVRETAQKEFELIERQVGIPYIKDYDAIAGEHPIDWTKRFDLSNWGFFSASMDGRNVGGAAVAFNTSGVELLKARANIAALLWDIRVVPDGRGKGIGSALFNAASEWAQARGCRELWIETQNTNVPACNFYQRQGCVLVAVNTSAYPELPEETQLLWKKSLSIDDIRSSG